MAKFLKIADSYLNVDMIVGFKYNQELNVTSIITPYDVTIEENGDITEAILNTNNELSMRDKLFAREIENKLKSAINLVVRTITKKG